jgi:hypothetical protein
MGFRAAAMRQHRQAWLPAALPAPGRSIITTARLADELLHAYPSTSATFIAERVILGVAAGVADRSRSNRGGRSFAHRENYDRLTR